MVVAVLRSGVILIGTFLATAVLAGCGGKASPSGGADDRSAQFQRHGFDITFRYPTSLKEADDLTFGSTAGSADSARAGVGVNMANVILVSRYDLRRPVTAANVGRVRAEVDGVIAGLAGSHVPGRRVDFGGLPGYAYRVTPGSPAGGVSRLYVLFDGQVEYFFNCQSTPETRTELDRACDEALRTLERA
jgi:hypothetical protein